MTMMPQTSATALVDGLCWRAMMSSAGPRYHGTVPVPVPVPRTWLVYRYRYRYTECRGMRYQII